uniref:Uncharacterized protein n=1 Tax=Opuntia streptacantha TaxID=393608 RepID=A0A7C9AJ91_OPUST
MVRFSWMPEKVPITFPPKSGNVSDPGRGPTTPFQSTSKGYLRRWLFISVTSSAANCLQLCSARLLTRLTHSKLSGCLKQSSTLPRCSAHRDILYPYTCPSGLDCLLAQV